ncbi:hypothetical protein GCM10008956_30950 [Deinococcus arenae]|uniref:DUF4062 domain-containing protein n=1 Tax=Deinococcus arenae TaxID=1452751 RepID=A0A8H9L7F5_9DEIO|nr:DUF4062 domain-containing protein [Deinococcus arenae]AWT34641.1 hypothetical protein DM785_02995 [Deinococcus actinosclerus]GGM52755.1 hypothetical protein GCM10008956_30950 [Deinococcus arenae]
MSFDKRYTVFVSSTYKDLIDARWAVARSLMRLNLIPLGMESFTASDLSQWDIIKKTIDLSDYYVLILGNCYGSTDSESGISYTEKEYRYALSKDIPCLAFLSRDLPVKTEHLETDYHREKLGLLRQEVSRGRMVDFWSNVDDLSAKVLTATHLATLDTPRPGWIRNPQSSPEVAEELARLSRINAELEQKIKEITKIEQDSTFINVELLERNAKISRNQFGQAYISIKIKLTNNSSTFFEGIRAAGKFKYNDFESQIITTDKRVDIPPWEDAILAIQFPMLPSKDLKLENINLSFRITGHNLSAPIHFESETQIISDPRF